MGVVIILILAVLGEIHSILIFRFGSFSYAASGKSNICILTGQYPFRLNACLGLILYRFHCTSPSPFLSSKLTRLSARKYVFDRSLKSVDISFGIHCRYCTPAFV